MTGTNEERTHERRAGRVRSGLLLGVIGIDAVAFLVASALLVSNYQREISVADGAEFEIRLVADHLIVFWGPSTTWRSLGSLTWNCRQYRCAWPLIFLFSPGPLPPVRSVVVPLWIVWGGTLILGILLWGAGRRLKRPRCPARAV